MFNFFSTAEHTFSPSRITTFGLTFAISASRFLKQQSISAWFGYFNFPFLSTGGHLTRLVLYPGLPHAASIYLTSFPVFVVSESGSSLIFADISTHKASYVLLIFVSGFEYLPAISQHLQSVIISPPLMVYTLNFSISYAIFAKDKAEML